MEQKFEKENFHAQGQAAIKDGRYTEAYQYLVQAFNQPNHSHEVYYDLARACYFLGEKEEAKNHIHHYISQPEGPNYREALNLLGQCCDNQEEAEKLYKAAIEDPKVPCVAAFHNLGVLYTGKAEALLESNFDLCLSLFQEAKKYLENAIDASQNYPHFFRSMAIWCEKYTEVIKKQNQNVTMQLIGHFGLATKHYKTALKLCREDDTGTISLIKSDLAECLAQLGHVYYKDTAYQKAKEWYNKALGYEPGHAVALNQLGMCLFNQGQFKEAREIFSRLTAEIYDQDDRSDAYLNIAFTHLEEHNFVAGNKALVLAIALVSTNNFSQLNEIIDKKALSELKTAATCMQEKQFDAAQQALNKAKVLKPNDKDINNYQNELNALLESLKPHSLANSTSATNTHSKSPRFWSKDPRKEGEEKTVCDTLNVVNSMDY